MSEENKSYFEKFDDSTRLFSKEAEEAQQEVSIKAGIFLLITSVIWIPLVLWMADGDGINIGSSRELIRYIAWKIGFPIEL